MVLALIKAGSDQVSRLLSSVSLLAGEYTDPHLKLNFQLQQNSEFPNVMIEIHSGIKNLSNTPDIGFQYQDDGTPWPSVAAAHNGVAPAYIAPGKIRFVDSGNGPVEYWYKGGIEQQHLVPRYENLESSLEYINALNQIKDDAQQILSSANQVLEDTQSAAAGVIKAVGTINAATGLAVLTETGETFTPTTAPTIPDGHFLEVTEPGTLSITGSPVLAKVGGIFRSYGTKWGYVPYPTDIIDPKNSPNLVAYANQYPENWSLRSSGPLSTPRVYRLEGTATVSIERNSKGLGFWAKGVMEPSSRFNFLSNSLTPDILPVATNAWLFHVFEARHSPGANNQGHYVQSFRRRGNTSFNRSTGSWKRHVLRAVYQPD
jgi:hypothetical protein